MRIDFPVLLETDDLNFEGLSHLLRRNQPPDFALQPLSFLLRGHLAQRFHPSLDTHGFQKKLLRNQLEGLHSFSHFPE